MSSKKVTVNVISDVACPWCWVGKRSIEAAAANVGIDLELRWHPFQLDASIPHENASRNIEKLYSIIGNKQTVDSWVANPDSIPMNRSCAAYGLQGIRFALFSDTQSFNTYRAHTLLTYIGAVNGDYAKQNLLKDVLLRKTHAEGKNMDNIAELTEAAEEAGIAQREEEVSKILDDAAVKKVLDAELREARRHSNFNGVPYFMFSNGESFSGSQPVSEFEKILKKLQQ